MAEEFKPITTQADLDAAMKPHLERAAAEAAQKYAGYISPDDAAKNTKSLTDQIEALKGKVTGHEATIADLTAKNKAHEISAAKTRIAHEAGLPPELAGRLTGETDTDIKADAERLAGLLKASQPPTPAYVPDAPPSPAALHDAAFLSMSQNLK